MIGHLKYLREDYTIILKPVLNALWECGQDLTNLLCPVVGFISTIMKFQSQKQNLRKILEPKYLDHVTKNRHYFLCLYGRASLIQ